MEWTDDQPIHQGWYWFRVYLESRQVWRHAEIGQLNMATFQGQDGKPERKMCLFPAPFVHPLILHHYCLENRVQWCRIPEPKERRQS